MTHRVRPRSWTKPLLACALAIAVLAPSAAYAQQMFPAPRPAREWVRIEIAGNPGGNTHCVDRANVGLVNGLTYFDHKDCFTDQPRTENTRIVRYWVDCRHDWRQGGTAWLTETDRPWDDRNPDRFGGNEVGAHLIAIVCRDLARR